MTDDAIHATGQGVPVVRSTRLRAYWDHVLDEEKKGMEVFELAHGCASMLFPSNPEAREALVEIIGAQWCRLRYGE